MLTVVALSGGPPSALGEITIASFSFTAIVALLTGAVSWTLVLLYNRVTRAAARAASIFVVFIVWVIASMVIGEATRQGVQFLLVQSAFLGSLLVAATARHVVGSRLDDLAAKCFQITTSVLIVAAILGTASSQLKLGVRPSSIISLVCLAWFLASYRQGDRSGLWWSVATFAGIAISLSRSSLFAAFILVTATAFLSSKTHRARNLVLGVLFIVAGYWLVTSWAPLRDRFSQGDVSLSVGGLNINAEGRTRVWGVLWSDAQDQLLIGRGSGAAGARSFALDPAFDQPHNDYLRIVYDFGIVGLGLLLWFSVRTTRLMRRARKRSPTCVAPLAALNAGLAIAILMATDNPLEYPFVMIPFGALLGLGLGVTVDKHRDVRATGAREARPDLKADPGGRQLSAEARASDRARPFRTR